MKPGQTQSFAPSGTNDRIMPEMSTIEIQFTEAMRQIYRRAAAELDYRPTRFLQMVDELGGVATARELLAAPVQEGFTTLWEHGRLDLSMEALVLQPPWNPLFTEAELAEARRRLDEAGYRGT